MVPLSKLCAAALLRGEEAIFISLMPKAISNTIKII